MSRYIMAMKKSGTSLAHDHFFFPPDVSEFYLPLDSVMAKLSGRLSDIAAAFKKNLEAVLSTASSPFHLVTAAVSKRRFQQVLIAQKIRARGWAADTDEERDRLAWDSAQEKYNSEVASDEGRDQHVDAVLLDLQQLLEASHIRQSAAELIRQSTVLVWGALEVVLTDIFVAVVNGRPASAGALLRDERCKKRFVLKDILGTLERFTFDLSQHMGDILLETRKLDDVETFRIVLDVLFPENEHLRQLLGMEKLWLLNQQRNLILHRRAVVDEVYLKNTGDKLKKGDELCISPSQLEDYLGLVRNIGMEALIASGSTLTAVPKHLAPFDDVGL